MHQLHHLVQAIVGQPAAAPMAADCCNGYINAILCDAQLLAAKTGRRVRLKPVNR